MRFRDFNDYDIFPATHSRQREAVRWLQRRIIKAFTQPRDQPHGFFARLFGSNKSVDCLLRIIDPMGIAATDLAYDFAWSTNIGRLKRRTERLRRASAKNTGQSFADRALKHLSPMAIRAAEQAMADERRVDTANEHEDVYCYIEAVLFRWRQIWVRNDHVRSNPIDSWFLANHQAPLWDFFDNRCSQCGARPAQFRDRTIDHAFTPFSKGGTFLMLDRPTQQWFLNAIPLCRSCNSIKGNRPIEKFFTPDKLRKLTDKLRQYPIERPVPDISE